MSRSALVIGGLSQSGRLLIKSLLADGYKVTATARDINADYEALKKIGGTWYTGIDFANLSGQIGAIDKISDMVRSGPDEVYNLASVMYAPASWDDPARTYLVNLLPCVQILHSMRDFKDMVFVQAGSAEMYRKSLSPISRESWVGPSTPYGVSKLAAYMQVIESRKKYGVKACTAIFFNMESGLRDTFFFARKAVLECVRVYREHHSTGEPVEMTFGPLGARRDWGLTREYVEVMRRMASQAAQGYVSDRVVGTGEVHTCYEFVKECLEVLGIPQYWPVILNATKGGPAQSYDCMYASPADMMSLGVSLTGFKGVVRELVEEELKKSG